MPEAPSESVSWTIIKDDSKCQVKHSPSKLIRLGHNQVGRYYGLTETGQQVWEEVKSRIRPVSWTVIDPETPQQKRLLEFLENKFGDDLRIIGEQRDGTIELIYADDSVLSSYTDEEIERVLRKFVFQLSLEDAALPIADLKSEAKFYGEFIMIRVPIDDAFNVSVSVSGDTTISFPSITNKIEKIYK